MVFHLHIHNLKPARRPMSRSNILLVTYEVSSQKPSQVIARLHDSYHVYYQYREYNLMRSRFHRRRDRSESGQARVTSRYSADSLAEGPDKQWQQRACGRECSKPKRKG